MSRRVIYVFGALAVLAGVTVYSNMIRGENPGGRLEESVKDSGKGTYVDCVNLFGHEKYREALECFNNLLESEPENTEARNMRDKTIEILKNGV